MFRFLISIAFLLSILSACENPAVEPDLGYDYYPLEVGAAWTYQVDSIVYDPNGVSLIDTHTFELREILVDTFMDTNGLLWYRMEVYERADSTEDWSFTNTAAIARDATRAFREENNLNLIRLVFPPDPFARWESTTFIDPTSTVNVAGETIEMFKFWESSFASVDEPLAIEGQNFPVTCDVIHADFENLIELRSVKEVYAHGVGLVSRDWLILDTQVIDGSIPWEQKAEKGFIIRQRLLHFE